jgi:hypothetical protein
MEVQWRKLWTLMFRATELVISLCVRFVFALGSLWVRFGFALGSLWVRFGFALGSLWVRFVFALGSLWVRFGFVLANYFNLECQFLAYMADNRTYLLFLYQCYIEYNLFK